jgi:hypothetical protein
MRTVSALLGPVLALVALLGSMIRVGASVNGQRVRLKVETRWLDRVDFAFVIAIVAVATCSLAWLISHAFFGT